MAVLNFKIISLSILVCFFNSVFSKNDGPPVIKINQGDLSGEWKFSYGGRKFAEFKAVPYARPPVGEYRFQDPQPAQSWKGTWNATNQGNICMQYNPPCISNDRISGSDDCLFVYVSTPNPQPDASLPVVFYIHGGAFMFGTGLFYQGTHFMDRDVVYVSVNYRLGPLGFLSTQDDVVPGNMGLKDQNMALRWVKENIRAFGGNPDDVTIIGLSAGGASVHYQYLSPLSKGLFHRGIAFSGSALCPWTLNKKPLESTRALAAHLGCDSESTKEMMLCLKTRPSEHIVEAQSIFFRWHESTNLFTQFMPVVEPATYQKAFISEHPYAIASSGKSHAVPLIATYVGAEGVYPGGVYQSSLPFLDDLDDKWEDLASFIFMYNDTLPNHKHKDVAKKIKEHYFKNEKVGENTIPQLIQALGDRLFVTDILDMAELHARTTGQPTFLYKYMFSGAASLSHILDSSNRALGASHGDDILHAFQLPFFDSCKTEADAKIKDFILDLIYSFAINKGIPKIKDVEWKPLDPNSKELQYLEILSGEELQIKVASDLGERSFWKSLHFSENEAASRNIHEEL